MLIVVEFGQAINTKPPMSWARIFARRKIKFKLIEMSFKTKSATVELKKCLIK